MITCPLSPIQIAYSRSKKKKQWSYCKVKRNKMDTQTGGKTSFQENGCYTERDTYDTIGTTICIARLSVRPLWDISIYFIYIILHYEVTRRYDCILWLTYSNWNSYNNNTRYAITMYYMIYDTCEKWHANYCSHTSNSVLRCFGGLFCTQSYCIRTVFSCDQSATRLSVCPYVTPFS